MSTTKMNAPTGSARITTNYGNYTAGADGTAVVDSRAVPELLKGGWTVFDGDLPPGNVIKGGQHTTTSGEAAAHAVAINTGLSALTTYGVHVYRSNADMHDFNVTVSGGIITVADNGVQYNVTAGDVVNWFALGTE